jgi:hypothetical protein
VFQPAAMLTVSLTVAVQRLKKPFIYAGFNNLNTEGNEGNGERQLIGRRGLMGLMSLIYFCYVNGLGAASV